MHIWEVGEEKKEEAVLMQIVDSYCLLEYYLFIFTIAY